MWSSRRLALTGALVLLAPAGAVVALGQADALQTCAERVREDPDNDRSYRCYWVASRKVDRDAALRALEALRSLEPDNPHVLYYLAHIERDRGGAARSALLFAERGIAEREVWAWLSRFDGLRRQGRAGEAEESLDNAARAARDVEDPVLRARVSIWRASALIDRQDYGAAIRHLREAEKEAFPDGPEDLKKTILWNLARTEIKLGRWEQALAYHRRRAELPSVQASPSSRAESLYMITVLTASVQSRRGGWSAEEHEETVGRLREIVEICVQDGVASTEARARPADTAPVSHTPESVH